MINLTKEQINKIADAKGYHDTYFVDVLLKNGTIKYNLSAREKVILVATSSCQKEDYDFKAEDIEDIRPTIGLLSKLTDPWKRKKRNT